ncbi:PAS domain-containing protein [Kiloniella laminariae]|uniref:PAS domain-containing protein n=1 Tax=Kiloniella laminariae TaxID=454162 RepID=A0ABT4LH66_9PROT|nr:PAS domain-containing protein [Kiloniella laminariae]MCZ4279691.1 PAS domain-containing protein [Kiloniella laminariae]
MLFEIRNPRNQIFYDYWRNLPRVEGELLPRKSSFLPEDIPSILPNIIVYELQDKDQIMIRLQGTAINQRFGHDMTGANYLDYVEPDRREKAASAFWLMAEQPCGIIAILDHALSSGRSITVESIGFPLINDFGPNPIIIYQSNEIEREEWRNRPENEKLKLIFVQERHLIDLGTGTPQFVD